MGVLRIRYNSVGLLSSHVQGTKNSMHQENTLVSYHLSSLKQKLIFLFFLSLPFFPFPSGAGAVSINFHAFPRQVLPRFLYLLHQFVVGFGHIVKGEDAPAELEEQEAAEGDEGPEGELQHIFVSTLWNRGSGGGALCLRVRMGVGHIRRGRRRLGSWWAAG